MNGSVVLFQDKIIYSSPMDKIYVKELLAKFESLNIQYMLQSHVYSYLKDEYIDILKYYKRFGIYEKYLKNCYDIDSIDVYKIDILCKNKEAIDYCLSLKKTSMSVGCDLENGVFYLSSGDESKGKGIKKALEYMNIPVENSYAFGDETNDTEMLKAAGCGIAIGMPVIMLKVMRIK